MAQTHVLAAHLETHSDLIADPDTPTEPLIATFTVEAFEGLWEPKGWVLVNRSGEAVPDIEHADPERQDEFLGESAPVDRQAARKAAAAKFTRSSKKSSASSSSSSTSSTASAAVKEA